MKRKVLAMLVPALLVAGAANAAEIYNKNGNKVDFYGKMVGERIWSNVLQPTVTLISLAWLMVLILRFSTKAKTATVALRNKMVTAMRCL